MKKLTAKQKEKILKILDLSDVKMILDSYQNNIHKNIGDLRTKKEIDKVVNVAHQNILDQIFNLFNRSFCGLDKSLDKITETLSDENFQELLNLVFSQKHNADDKYIEAAISKTFKKATMAELLRMFTDIDFLTLLGLRQSIHDAISGQDEYILETLGLKITNG